MRIMKAVVLGLALAGLAGGSALACGAHSSKSTAQTVVTPTGPQTVVTSEKK